MTWERIIKIIDGILAYWWEFCFNCFFLLRIQSHIKICVLVRPSRMEGDAFKTLAHK